MLLFLIITMTVGLAGPVASAVDWLPPATNLPFNDVPKDAWFYGQR